MTSSARPILLNGFMATGKSTVGKLVAAASGLPFVDLDARVEQHAGKRVAAIFADEGEGAFRALERQVLAEVLAESPSVVALGGGALLHSETRWAALERAVVVTLQAAPETLLQRAHADTSSVRPLLRGGDLVHLTTILESRAPAYAEAHAVIATDNLEPSAIAQRVVEVWKKNPIAVASKEQSYVVEVGRGFAAEALPRALGKCSGVLLVTDATVDGLYGETYRAALSRHQYKHFTHVLTPGEEYKNLASIEAIWETALKHGADRKLRVLGVGGGVVTDVAGFAAATWMRGVTWHGVSTTLLGMVDASVGGKTAVDLPLAKNCVGAFWQPRSVYCDVDHLKTEPLRGYRSGLAEVVKTALLGDAPLFELLETQAPRLATFDAELIEEVVRRCIAVKAAVVSRDPRESGIRAALNLGHTIGHAIESVGGFGHHTHGEAISLGLVAAFRLGTKLGFTPGELTQRVTRLLSALGLPTALENEPLEKAAELLGYDKKRGGSDVKFVFCPEPGRVHFELLPLTKLQALTPTLGHAP
jgi:shikimate kinase / 3-dehydroquinate synthase